MKKLFVMTILVVVLCGILSLTAMAETSYCLSDFGNTVNTGLDNGYSGSNPINGNDVHFGWTLGKFYLTGYSDVIMENDVPVFLVNDGDKIELSYRLSQANLDGLNGKDGLKICDDVNGYDQKFQYEKTDFQKGMLLVKYTDWNGKATVTAYSNYLQKVVLKYSSANIFNMQEGDYEIALDYEIESPAFLHAQHNNYRTTVKFKVRNANCMEFLREIGSKSEVANYSVATDGFFVDLAKSRYLKLDISRQIFTDNGYGKYTLTPRESVRVADQTECKDAGIYTIIATNEYTKNKVEMTVAVGTNELINAYVTSSCEISLEEIQRMVDDGMAVITDDWRVEMIEQPEEEEIDQIVIETVDDTDVDDSAWEVLTSYWKDLIIVALAAVTAVSVTVSSMRNRKYAKLIANMAADDKPRLGC